MGKLERFVLNGNHDIEYVKVRVNKGNFVKNLFGDSRKSEGKDDIFLRFCDSEYFKI